MDLDVAAALLKILNKLDTDRRGVDIGDGKNAVPGGVVPAEEGSTFNVDKSKSGPSARLTTNEAARMKQVATIFRDVFMDDGKKGSDGMPAFLSKKYKRSEAGESGSGALKGMLGAAGSVVSGAASGVAGLLSGVGGAVAGIGGFLSNPITLGIGAAVLGFIGVVKVVSNAIHTFVGDFKTIFDMIDPGMVGKSKILAEVLANLGSGIEAFIGGKDLDWFEQSVRSINTVFAGIGLSATGKGLTSLLPALSLIDSNSAEKARMLGDVLGEIGNGLQGFIGQKDPNWFTESIRSINTIFSGTGMLLVGAGISSLTAGLSTVSEGDVKRASIAFQIMETVGNGIVAFNQTGSGGTWREVVATWDRLFIDNTLSNFGEGIKNLTWSLRIGISSKDVDNATYAARVLNTLNNVSVKDMKYNFGQIGESVNNLVNSMFAGYGKDGRSFTFLADTIKSLEFVNHIGEGGASTRIQSLVDPLEQVTKQLLAMGDTKPNYLAYNIESIGKALNSIDIGKLDAFKSINFGGIRVSGITESADKVSNSVITSSDKLAKLSNDLLAESKIQTGYLFEIRNVLNYWNSTRPATSNSQSQTLQQSFNSSQIPQRPGYPSVRS